MKPKLLEGNYCQLDYGSSEYTPGNLLYDIREVLVSEDKIDNTNGRHGVRKQS